MYRLPSIIQNTTKLYLETAYNTFHIQTCLYGRELDDKYGNEFCRKLKFTEDGCEKDDCLRKEGPKPCHNLKDEQHDDPDCPWCYKQ